MVRFSRVNGKGLLSPASGTPITCLVGTIHTAFCTTQRNRGSDQSWKQARGKQRKNVCLLPTLWLPGRGGHGFVCSVLL